MIGNPFEGIPFKEAAWAEGFCKGLAAFASPSPSASISSEDFDAFNDGVATGANAAGSGIPFDTPCVAALEGSPGHGAGLAINGIHILHSAWEARHLASLSAAFAGLLVAVISLGTSAHHLLPANQVLPQLGEEITEKLASFGAGSLELFAAVNLDLSSEDCTMFMPRLFLSLDEARPRPSGPRAATVGSSLAGGPINRTAFASSPAATWNSPLEVVQTGSLLNCFERVLPLHQLNVTIPKLLLEIEAIESKAHN